MDCCGRPRTTTELTLVEHRFSLSRCSACNSRQWTRDGQAASLRQVTDTITLESTRIVAVKARRLATTPVAPRAA
jgi:hypothetical protein